MTAAAALELRIADVTYNTKQIAETIRSLPDCGLIVFPELSVTGYTCADLFQSDLLLKRALEAVFTIAGETEGTGTTAVVGVPLRIGNSLYNCGAVLSRGAVKAFIPKSYAQRRVRCPLAGGSETVS